MSWVGGGSIFLSRSAIGPVGNFAVNLFNPLFPNSLRRRYKVVSLNYRLLWPRYKNPGLG